MIGSISGIVTCEEFEALQAQWQAYLAQHRDSLLVDLDATERMMGRAPRTASIRKWAQSRMHEIREAELVEDYALTESP